MKTKNHFNYAVMSSTLVTFLTIWINSNCYIPFSSAYMSPDPTRPRSQVSKLGHRSHFLRVIEKANRRTEISLSSCRNHPSSNCLFPSFKSPPRTTSCSINTNFVDLSTTSKNGVSSSSSQMNKNNNARTELIDDFVDQVLDLLVTEEETPIESIIIEKLTQKITTRGTKSFWSKMTEIIGKLPSSTETSFDPLGLRLMQSLIMTPPQLKIASLDAGTKKLNTISLSQTEMQEISTIVLRKLWQNRSRIVMVGGRLATKLLQATTTATQNNVDSARMRPEESSRYDYIEQLDEYIDSQNKEDIKRHLDSHVYLNNNYAPVSEEHHIPELAVVVEGKIPNDLDGLFVRNGPNPIPNQQTKYHHWFDGHGHLHNLRIKNGSALYSNAFIPTPRYTIEQEEGKQYFGTVGELNGISGMMKVALISPRKLASKDVTSLTSGQANTHTIMTSQNKFYACHEGSLPFELQLNNDGTIVKSIGYETFDGALDYPVSAHPKNDPKTGEFIFHSYTPDPNLIKKYGSMKVGIFNPNKNVVDPYIGIRSSEDDHIPFSHDMAFTENYIAIYDTSAHLDPMQMFNRTARADLITWKEEHKMKIGLLPRKKHGVNSDDVTWFELDKPYMMAHTLNAWEDEHGNVILWAPVAETWDNFKMAEVVLNVERGTVKLNIIDRLHNVEFPRVRDDKVGSFTRFGISSIIDPNLGGDALSKGYVVFDMKERKLHSTVEYGKGDIGGEAILIPKEGKVDESDKMDFYVGVYVFNTFDEMSYFVLYDDGKMITRLKLPYRVPYGFHAYWITGKQLQSHIEYHKSNWSRK